MHNLLLQLVFTNYRISFKSRLVLVIAHPRIEWIFQSLVNLIKVNPAPIEASIEKIFQTQPEIHKINS